MRATWMESSAQANDANLAAREVLCDPENWSLEILKIETSFDMFQMQCKILGLIKIGFLWTVAIKILKKSSRDMDLIQRNIC